MTRNVMHWIMYLFVSATAAFAVALWAIPAAFRERGYSAVGGEWLLIVCVFLAVLWVVSGRK